MSLNFIIESKIRGYEEYCRIVVNMYRDGKYSRIGAEEKMTHQRIAINQYFLALVDLGKISENELNKIRTRLIDIYDGYRRIMEKL